MSIPEVEVPQERIVYEALQDDIHIAGSAHIVDATNTARTAWCFDSMSGDESGVFLGGIGEEIIVFSLSAYSRSQLADDIHVGDGCSMAALDLLTNEPVLSFRNLNSSRVGSQTKSSHIWQNKLPVLDSTSTQS